MLDARFVRQDTDTVRKALENRGSDWDIDEFLALEVRRRELIAELESSQALRNASSKAIGGLLKEGRKEEAETLKGQVQAENDKIASAQEALASVESVVSGMLMSVPNLPDASVPIGSTEEQNIEVRRWKTPPTFDFEPKAHWELGSQLGLIDFERGVKLAKSRFVVLGRDGARLNRALVNFMLDTHILRGYTEWSVPIIANTETLTGTGQLPKFEEDLFSAGDGFYLIPTAEVQLTNLHRAEVLDAGALPLSYAAYTPCFRKEAGAAGRDTRGMIRAHQFDKVELVKFATPETSFAELEKMVVDAEHILQQLDLAYRVITLCTGDMGFASAKTYDIEVWLPSYTDYKEVSSCSNCTDFQARRAAIKYRSPREFSGSRFAHTLNGSGLAVGRTLVAVLENYQQADGSVVVPEVLRPYLGGQKIIG